MKTWFFSRETWGRGLAVSGAVLLVCLLGTVLFWIWPLDLAISRPFHSAEGGWFLQHHPAWSFVYRFGTLPAVLLALAALAVFVGGWRRRAWRRYRRIAGYLVLCLAVGPGLLINLCLKGQWGRPRPRSIEEFGGRYAHEAVLTYDPASPGQSFPCGHCSMGFYFFALTFLFGWRSRRGWMAGAAALGFGTLLGATRIVQGGHFASDVWWSAGICLATAGFLYHAMGLHRDPWYELTGEPVRRRPPRWVLAASGAAAAGLIAAVLLATPYRDELVYEPRVRDDRRFDARLELEGDRHLVTWGEPWRIVAEGQGHGVPGSAVKSEFFEWPGEDSDEFLFRQRLSGWFRELDHENRVAIPGDRPGSVSLEAASGEVWLVGPPPAVDQEWEIRFPEGDGRVVVGEAIRRALEDSGSLTLDVDGGAVVPRASPEPVRQTGG